MDILASWMRVLSPSSNPKAMVTMKEKVFIFDSVFFPITRSTKTKATHAMELQR